MPPPNHSERIKSLEDQVRSLLAALEARSAPAPSPSENASVQQGLRSKEPEVFAGERGHLEPFLAQVDVFLRLNPGCFINDSDQILWLSTLLRGVAHQWFYPHLSAVNPPAWLTDYPLFIHQLRVVFGDPDCIATAKREIEALAQTTSVANYLTQFRQLQMTLNWGEDAMAWFFYRGLKENVKDDLSRSGKPTDLETLIQRSLEIDNRIAERISEKKRTITQSANPAPLPASNPPIAPTIVHPSSPSALHVPLTTAGKLDPGEYKRRQTNNLSTQARTAKHRLTAFAPVDSQPPGNQYLSTSLRLCVDYRGLNQITIRNRYPLPLIDELLDRLRKARFFTHIDLCGAYNLLCIAKGDEWKTAFRTRYGLFQYNVMPFGLTNAPASFQHLMNDTFKDMLDRSLIIYLDDLLIYSSTLEQHQGHVSAVLARLRQAGLYAKAEKCQFSTSQTKFLGFVVSDQGVSMDPSKTEVITNWPVPTSVHDVQVFLGFCNFYRKFIPQYSRTAYPLTQLLRKEAQSTPFAWNHAAQHAFEQLRSSFSTDTILHHFDPARPIIVETDASDFAVAAVLSQSFDQGTRHPIAFFSKKLDPAQLNYPIFDKEMFAIVAAFKHWRQYLEGAKFPVQVLTDHRSLEYFTTTKQLNRRQARWSELLSDFDFVIQYHPGVQAGLPDALTLKSDITDKIREALSSDSWTSALLEQAHLGSLPPGFAIDSRNLLTYRDSVCVPDVDDLRLLIIQDRHNSPSVGHPGRIKTLSLVRRSFFWPGLSKFVHTFVDSCETCRRIKAARHKPYGHLKSLPVPPHPWSSISMDLIEQLPPSSGFTAILVVVDRLTKMATFVPTTNTLDAPELAKLFLRHVYSKHGLPTSIVSDRGSKFTSHFWRSLSALLGIRNHFSSAYHPQSDGQTERVNQVLEQYLRGYSNHLQTNWSDLLPLAEFSYNNAEHASTQLTPFFANYGYHPRFSFDNTDPASLPLFPAARSYADQLKQLHEYVRGELDKANRRSAEQFDKHRLPSPQFQPGDRVWLAADNICSLRPTKKLDYRRLGPFSVSEVISSHAYRLQLPPSMKIHNVFHVDRLEPYVANTIPNRVQPPPPPVEVESDLEYEVEQILDSKVDHRYRDPLFYLVRWVGYGPDHNSWEPASNLTHASDLIAEFHTVNPTRPSPTYC
ncbi:uncharacterized protein UDID_18660 [Ustilago sp. UG-2017a]|nr:uncharacterized protein UDID_18660 [Ustilago sp. UG-2017a]